MKHGVYYWQAGDQILYVDSLGRVLDVLGGGYFTIRYTASRRPKTLVYLGEL